MVRVSQVLHNFVGHDSTLLTNILLKAHRSSPRVSFPIFTFHKHEDHFLTRYYVLRDNNDQFH